MAKRHLTIEEKEKLIKEFKNSNYSKIQFCKKNQIGVTAFHSWMINPQSIQFEVGIIKNLIKVVVNV